MSWDVFVFKANRVISDISDIEEELLVDIGTWQEFRQLLTAQFPEASFDDNWCTIGDEQTSLETSLGPPDEKMSNTIFHLYGPNAIYLLAALCQRNDWQAFDTSLDAMLNPDKPDVNGYLNFAAYLAQIKKGS
ncbi:hypothetical protein [Hymenobacter cheonanensis]|uniref:hypothetical protein n=1 Tax=Hymenobacter sp. CA2-7 TaxID=3063993 RepID=UPI00271248E4|nr:hypothetical protein [Hymenobacter sp. CA2-7]MDO7884095.1 hypothetical protein [Hymenobacter sp. CA2-7]